MSVAIAKLTQTDYCRRAAKTQKPQMVVIPYSHFCELAVWSLQLGKVPFELHGFAPGEHLLPVLALRQGDSSRVSSTSVVQPVKGSAQSDSELKEKKVLQARSTAVPVLAMPDGRILVDSWSIAKESTLPPIDEKMIPLYDEELGPLARQLAYSFLLKESNRNVWHGLCTDGRGWVWGLVWWLGFGSQVTQILTKTFATDDAAATAACREKLVAVFNTLDERVRNRRGRYLNGDELGVEDVAMASLASAALAPPEYCGGTFAKWFKQLEAQDEELRKDLEYWRSTEAGKYALGLYREHRVSPQAGP